SVDDLKTLVASVNPAYLTNGKWTMAPSTLLAIQTLKDNTGAYVLSPQVAAKQAETVLGYEVVQNPYVPEIGAAKRIASFGDHTGFGVRQVLGLTVLRLNETGAESGLVEFICYDSADSGYIDPAAVRILAMKAE